jgi:hypothetical protein
MKDSPMITTSLPLVVPTVHSPPSIGAPAAPPLVIAPPTSSIGAPPDGVPPAPPGALPPTPPPPPLGGASAPPVPDIAGTSVFGSPPPPVSIGMGTVIDGVGCGIGDGGTVIVGRGTVAGGTFVVWSPVPSPVAVPEPGGALDESPVAEGWLEVADGSVEEEMTASMSSEADSDEQAAVSARTNQPWKRFMSTVSAVPRRVRKGHDRPPTSPHNVSALLNARGA